MRKSELKHIRELLCRSERGMAILLGYDDEELGAKFVAEFESEESTLKPSNAQMNFYRFCSSLFYLDLYSELFDYAQAIITARRYGGEVGEEYISAKREELRDKLIAVTKRERAIPRPSRSN